MSVQESIFLNAALISHVVGAINALDEKKQIGKTFLQKIFYCLMRNKLSNFTYSLYHYGPYSNELSKELNFAENSHFIEINWKDNKGYFIKPTSNSKKIESYITKKEKQSIDKIIMKYIDFTAQELSILTTAYYLIDEYDTKVGSLIESVKEIKPNYETQYIENVLKKSELI
jgi:uncharacterized protein YwgA